MNQADQKKTVLLVDDAPANIQIVNSILKDIYKIRIATNGAKALELAKVTPPPDLILLDVMMPEMDGYEVCTQLKLDSRDAGYTSHISYRTDRSRGGDKGIRCRRGGLHS